MNVKYAFVIFFGLALAIGTSSCSETKFPSVENGIEYKVEYTIDKYGENLQSADTTFYFYDDTGLLQETKKTSSYEPRKEFFYENERLKSIALFYPGDNETIHEFVFSYQNDRISSYTENMSNSFFDRETKVDIDYDNNGYPEKMEEFSVLNDNTYESIKELNFNDGNLKSELSKNNGVKSLLFDYDHDNSPNPFRGNPDFFLDFRYWQSNNVVKSVATDYTGLYDPICLECITSIEYNNDGLPVKFKSDWMEVIVKYE